MPEFMVQAKGITLVIAADGPPPRQGTPREREIIQELEGGAGRGRCLVLPLEMTREAFALIFTIFKCQRCGACCTRGAGTEEDKGIFLFPEEQERLAPLLGLSLAQFRQRCRPAEKGGVHLPYPCPFYDGEAAGCRIYEERPAVCRQFPIEGVERPPGTIPIASFCPASREVALHMRLMLEEVERRAQAMLQAGVTDWRQEEP